MHFPKEADPFVAAVCIEWCRWQNASAERAARKGGGVSGSGKTAIIRHHVPESRRNTPLVRSLIWNQRLQEVPSIQLPKCLGIPKQKSDSCAPREVLVGDGIIGSSSSAPYVRDIRNSRLLIWHLLGEYASQPYLMFTIR